MELSGAVITSEAVAEFEKIYEKKNRRPSEKSEKAIRKLLEHVTPVLERYQPDPKIDKIALYGAFGFLFWISLEPTLAIVKVTNTAKIFEVPKVLKEMRKSNIPVLVVPVINPAKLCFTDHALERFAERFSVNPAEAEIKARQLFSEATEIDAIDDVARVKRLIANHLQEARYFLAGKCRFVVREEANGDCVVLTIEFDYFRGRP